MASSTPGYGATVTCPYNKSHNILKERFQTHLVKCSKQYPDIKLKKCPFNSTHLILEAEFDVCKLCHHLHNAIIGPVSDAKLKCFDLHFIGPRSNLRGSIQFWSIQISNSTSCAYSKSTIGTRARICAITGKRRKLGRCKFGQKFFLTKRAIHFTNKTTESVERDVSKKTWLFWLWKGNVDVSAW